LIGCPFGSTDNTTLAGLGAQEVVSSCPFGSTDNTTLAGLGAQEFDLLSFLVVLTILQPGWEPKNWLEIV